MSTDKRPLADDHGAGLFHHAKDERERRRAGKPNHQPGLAAEHEKQQLPDTPWARTEPQAPGKNTPLGGAAQPGLPASGVNTAQGGSKNGRGRVLRVDASRAPLVEAGKSLYAPEAGPPKREVRVNGNVHDRHTPLSKRVRSGERPAAALASEHRAADKRKSGAQKAADAAGQGSHKEAHRKTEAPKAARPKVAPVVDYENQSLNG